MSVRLIIGIALAALLVGCGDNNCTITNNADGTSTVECGDKTATVGGDGCTITHNSDGTSTIKCDDGTTVTVGGPDESCTIVHNNDGTSTITCGDGTMVTVGGHDDSCTIADNADGTSTITCDDGTSVTVGGPDSSCSVTSNAGSIVVTCDDGTVLTIANRAVVFFSTPDQPNGVLGDRATTAALCHAAAPTLYCPKGEQALISYTGDDLVDMTINYGVPNVPIVSLNGTLIANNWADLFDGNGITTSLLAAGVTDATVVFTGTNTDGTTSASNCDNWTVGSGAQATTGTPSSTNQFWITSTAGTITCNAMSRIVCLCF